MHKQLVIAELKRRLENMTPEEQQAAYLKVKQTQKEELLAKLKSMTPATRKAVLMAAKELKQEQAETTSQENQPVNSSNKS